MTHGKRLSYPNSAVFADTVVPSRCHRTIIRWLHDGIARASRSRVAFLRQSGSFALSSWGEKCPMAPMITRSKDEDDTIWQDALTMALRRAKWTQEFNTKMNLRKVLRQFVLHAKDFATAHEVATGACETPQAVIRWLKMPSRMADGFTIRTEFEHFLYRVSIWCQFPDSVTPASVLCITYIIFNYNTISFMCSFFPGCGPSSVFEIVKVKYNRILISFIINIEIISYFYTTYMVFNYSPFDFYKSSTKKFLKIQFSNQQLFI